MAENDIYRSRNRYEAFKSNLCTLVRPPSDRRRRKYYCKNPENLEYFRKLFIHFESKDLSYIRRIRLLQTMKFIVNYVSKNLAECTREDINEIMALMHSTYHTPKSKETFIIDLKHMWKILLPEKDEKGRPDETIMPYTVRHLISRIDKSRQKLRKDKLALEEFEKILNYFSSDPRMQAYLTLSMESLARPQELLYVKIGDVEFYDNYAKVYISEHGKEGVGLLQCIDSYPYLLKWFEIHPFRHDKQSFLFINTFFKNKCRQLRPQNINKMLRHGCKELKIDKPITCYSLKRNGVTIRRLRGESDMEIQHAARWTSTKQLKTYDLSSQDEAFRLALQKRGLIKADSQTKDLLKTKICPFCNETVGFGDIICPKCKHLLDRNAILSEKKKDQEIQRLKQTVDHMNSQFVNIKQQIMQELMEDILSKKQSFESPGA